MKGSALKADIINYDEEIVRPGLALPDANSLFLRCDAGEKGNSTGSSASGTKKTPSPGTNHGKGTSSIKG